MNRQDQDALDYHSSAPAGKIAIRATKPCMTQRDLSLAYTPGVAVPCLEIERDPDLAAREFKTNALSLVHLLTGLADRMERQGSGT